MHVVQPIVRRQYDHNPKGSATATVVMRAALPYAGEVRVTHSGNVPMGPLGEDAPASTPPQPVTLATAIEALKTTAISAGQTVAQGAAQRLANQLAKTKSPPKYVPSVIANVPRANWLIIGAATAVAGLGVFLLARRHGKPAGRRRR